MNYGKSFSENNSYVANNRLGNLPISTDNPYLPASIKAQMTTPYIYLGTNNMNNMSSTGSTLVNNSLSTEEQSLGIPVSTNRRELFRGVFSLDGTIGDDWSWNAYAQHGEARVHTVVVNNVLKSNYNNAVDAVLAPAGNALGVPAGTIVCRSSLTNPTNGCAPLDVFGTGVASPAAINYITGPARNGGNWALSVLNEDVISGSAQGVLPADWGLPAGRIAVAFGGEYRKEAARVTADANAQAVGWSVGNFAAFTGQYNVMEGFAEVTAPILKDSFVQSLDFNAAGRITSYSTSGMVETWKLGVTSQVNDDIRLRSTWSFDIRAPDLQELFATGFSVLATQPDIHNGNNPVSAYTLQGGNPNLKPEKSTTISGGIVLTPHWVDGLNLSVDYYSINIKGAIATIATNVILAQCQAGVQAFCNQLTFAGPIGPLGNPSLSQVATVPINANSQDVSGFDLQADYRFPLLSGGMDLHVLGNYIDSQDQTAAGVPTFDYAGSVGPDSAVQGIPKFRGSVSATYLEGPWQGTVQGRFIGEAKLNNAWGPLDVDNNHLPFVAYLDLRLSYKWNDDINLYGAIDNVTNVPPPLTPGTSNVQNFYDQGIRDTVYDAIGRQFRVGIRVHY